MRSQVRPNGSCLMSLKSGVDPKSSSSSSMAAFHINGTHVSRDTFHAITRFCQYYTNNRYKIYLTQWAIKNYTYLTEIILFKYHRFTVQRVPCHVNHSDLFKHKIYVRSNVLPIKRYRARRNSSTSRPSINFIG